jgi:hypothetical protein
MYVPIPEDCCNKICDGTILIFELQEQHCIVAKLRLLIIISQIISQIDNFVTITLNITKRPPLALIDLRRFQLEIRNRGGAIISQDCLYFGHFIK